PPFELVDVGQVQPGDVIVAVRGEDLPEEALVAVGQQMRSADGAPVPVTVERPVLEGLEGETSRHDVVVYNEMFIDLRNPFNDRYTHDVLGLIPLARINAMGDDKGRAALAGLKDGDVILKWGPHVYPTRAQIEASIRGSAGRPDDAQSGSWRRRLYGWFTEDLETDIPVVVQRGKRAISLEVTPKVADKGRPPSIGYQLNRVAGGLLRVAGVVEGDHDHPTPAAEAGIPKGAMILRVADVSVSTWPELVEQFRRRAGSTVNLAYRTIDGQEKTCDFRVPHCLRTKLGLSTLSNIVAISDQRSVTIEDSHLRRSIAVTNSYGLAQILRQVWNEADQSPTTVTVRYTELPGGPELEGEVVIDRQVLDPWLGRVKYGPALFMRQQTKILRADGPIDAVNIGVQKTVYFVLQVYTMLERMIFSRSVGLKQVSGPVGIVKAGGDFARMGFIQLLFFLAIISANLAVINFLPLPIVDGGLMVFLIIEKIKGTPVSIKVQVVTQMLGIVLLLSLFLYVTFQDVLRWVQ
ncbi:MAG: site-2 protease family protein, partial [Planctomycetes bacterium]|nr:site-2 protease family protein [Planctomycetota bacterium]